MSLQSCRLVALVTSKNRLQVVFLILRIRFQKRTVIGAGLPPAQRTQKSTSRASEGWRCSPPALEACRMPRINPSTAYTRQRSEVHGNSYS